MKGEGMKVRVTYTVEVDDRLKKALGYHWGDSTRDAFKSFLEQNGRSALPDLVYDYEQYKKWKAEPRD